jgi:hypothetical protein
MADDTSAPFGFPAVDRKKPVAAFDGGRTTSDGGVMLLPRPSGASGSERHSRRP